MFLVNVKYNTCAKFQEKIVNRTLIGAPGSFHFFKLNNKSLSKNHSSIFFSGEPV